MEKVEPSRRQKLKEIIQRSPLFAVKSVLTEYFLAIVLAASAAFLIRFFVIEAYQIPTDFMAPTLIPGDHIFVNKLAYAAGDGNPDLGDVVVFSFPGDKKKEYIKRVVARGGDTVEIRGGQLVINDKPVGTPVEGNPAQSDEILGEHKYRVTWGTDDLEARKMVSVKVPKGYLFVLGDNRATGKDSRSWGFLSALFLKGKASIIWFSSGQKVRWSRMFTGVN